MSYFQFFHHSSLTKTFLLTFLANFYHQISNLVYDLLNEDRVNLSLIVRILASFKLIQLGNINFSQ